MVEEKVIVLFDLVGAGTDGAKVYEERNEEKTPVIGQLVLQKNQFDRLGQPNAVHAVIEGVL